MSYGLRLAKRGFNLEYNGKASKWSIVIGSMVPRKKRTELEHYYILLYNDGEIYDRYYLDEGSVVSVKNEDIPNYVNDIISHIISTGDINKYLGDKTIDNQFTRIGKKENG